MRTSIYKITNVFLTIHHLVQYRIVSPAMAHCATGVKLLMFWSTATVSVPSKTASNALVKLPALSVPSQPLLHLTLPIVKLQ
jgi:hypothetical protein